MIFLFVVALVCPAFGAAAAPEAREIVDRVLNVDPWGLQGGEVTAHIVLTDKNGAVSNLAFNARSLRYDPPLAKSMVRFTAPADLAGAGFLQVQQRGGDDDRMLFLPELKRARRIVGTLRNTAFMGTDFSFADLDQRDLREGRAVLKGTETVNGKPCFRLEIVPQRADSDYSRIELWVRQETFLPVRWLLYDRSQTLFKKLEAREVRRVKGQWFISKSVMRNEREGHTTELVLDAVNPKTELKDEDFSVQTLEKL
jgi:hypothetical protein